MRAIPRVILVCLLGAACGGSSADSPTAPSPQTLAGTWKATRAEFVLSSNTSVRVEAVSQGTSFVLTLAAAGTYTQKIADPGEVGQTVTGTWSASSDVLSLKPTGMSWEIQFDMTFSGNTLTLNGGHVLFDVNNDGRDDEAILNLVLARQ